MKKLFILLFLISLPVFAENKTNSQTEEKRFDVVSVDKEFEEEYQKREFYNKSGERVLITTGVPVTLAGLISYSSFEWLGLELASLGLALTASGCYLTFKNKKPAEK